MPDRLRGFFITLPFIAWATIQCSFDMQPGEALDYFGQVPFVIENITDDAQNIRLVYSGNIQGPLLIFSHGSPGGWSDYKFYLKHPQLRKQALLVSYDRPGYGGTRPGQPAMRLAEQARVMHRVVLHMQALQVAAGFRPGLPILLGHSYGGPVVLRYAMDYPNAIDGLVLMASAADPELEEWMWYNRLAESGFVRWMLPVAWDVSNQELAALKQELGLMESIWIRIQAPAMIVHGTADRLVPFENATFIKRRLVHLSKDGDLRVEIIVDGDHFFIWSEEAMLADLILEWIQKNTGRGL